MTLRHLMLSMIALFFITGTISAAKPAKKEKSFFSLFQKESPVYLYSYYTGNGEDGLHLMYSHDGIVWRALNNGKSLLKPTVGPTKTMRDPSIAQDAQGTFHMVWTTGSENSIGYASSKDLINWSEQVLLPVMSNEPTVKNTLAPELIYDNISKSFDIVWASTIPGRFTENGKTEEESNNRLYTTTTTDFKSLSKTKLFYNPNFPVSDACFLKKGGSYYMFLKNDTENPLEKNIRYISSGRLKSFSKEVSEPISGKKLAEGPTAVQIGKYTYVYWNNYMDKSLGGARCNNLKKAQWENISDIIRFPAGAKQGTAFKAEDKILINLQKLGKVTE